MITRTKLTVLFACFALLAANTASACMAPINARLANQQARIQQGIQQGDLTVREQVKLQARHQHLRHVTARYRANDGVLGPRERCDLNRRLNASSAQIWRERHDRRRYR